MSGLLGHTVMTQVGLLVHDIEKVRAAYAKIFGVEEPRIFETDVPEKAQTVFNDKSSEARAKLAFLIWDRYSLS